MNLKEKVEDLEKRIFEKLETIIEIMEATYVEILKEIRNSHNKLVDLIKKGKKT